MLTDFIVCFKAVLPELRDASLAEHDEPREESAFIPDRIHDNDLHVFLNAARLALPSSRIRIRANNSFGPLKS